MSDRFNDARKFLESCEKMSLEGIVSKKADQPYKSGKNVGWVKV